MITDEEWAITGGGCRELSGDHRTGVRLQRRCQMLFIVDEDKIIGRGRFDAGHGADLRSAIADQACADGFGDLLQGALHRSHCIAAGQEDGRAGLSPNAQR